MFLNPMAAPDWRKKIDQITQNTQYKLSLSAVLTREKNHKVVLIAAFPENGLG